MADIALIDNWTHRSGTGLTFDVTTRYDVPLFEAFYTEYDKAFVLPSEKEERDGFAACLALNHGPAHADLMQRYGPFAELVMTVSDEDVVIGGANLVAMHFAGPDGPVTTSNLNYAFTTEAARGKGYFRALLAGVREVVETLFPPRAGERAYIFVEQNDPFRMAPADYEADTRHAGIDQFDRLYVWARVGAALVDFDYVQPALSAEQPADTGLAYSLLDPPKATLDAGMLADHLERFFAISVLKGGDPDANAQARAQLDNLRRRASHGDAIALIDIVPLLKAVTALDDRWSYWARRPASLTAAAFLR